MIRRRNHYLWEVQEWHITVLISLEKIRSAPKAGDLRALAPALVVTKMTSIWLLNGIPEKK